MIFNIEYDKNKESLTGAQKYPLIIRRREALPGKMGFGHAKYGGLLENPNSWLPGIILISEYVKEKESLTGHQKCY